MTSVSSELNDAEIKAFLETAPLYVWSEFRTPSAARSSLLIEEVDAFCDKCDRERPFHAYLSHGGGAGMRPPPALGTRTTEFEFECVSCGARREYHVQHIVSDGTIRMQKFGQLPRAAIPRDPILQKFLKGDRDHYEKGVVCLSNKYGIAAFVYFRRIVERNIGSLLDLVEEDAKASGADAEVLEAITKLRPESPMSERIKIANLALPSHLRVNGLNPLGRIYQALSKGVHTLSDDECLQKAQVLNDCLVFLTGELASRKQRRAQFLGGMRQL